MLWHLSGRFSEGRAALSGLLDLAPLSGVPPPEIPQAGAWAATMAANQGDYVEAEHLLQRALNVARTSDNEFAAVFAENQLGWISVPAG